MLCKCIFGKGVCSMTLFSLAVVNVLLTTIVSIVINYSYLKYRLVYILGSLFIMGMILQRMLCFPTS